MNFVVIVLSLCITAFAYDDLDDSFDFDNVSHDKELFRKVVDCFIDKEPCTPTMKKYKEHEYEAVNDACNECNRRQFHTFILFLTAMKDTLPEEYAEYMKKYDPDGSKIAKAHKKLDQYLKES